MRGLNPLIFLYFSEMNARRPSSSPFLGAREEVVRDALCAKYIRIYGWCTVELGKDHYAGHGYKEYLNANCELNSGKIRASGEGSKSSK